MKMPTTDERQAILTATRTSKMARSAHAYVRGNTALFYEWLAESPAARRVPEGPAVWICGDCHLGNLGPLADGAGGVEVQIRDLDQAVIGNPAHDLIRLGLSLATAARGSDLPGVSTARMIEAMIDGYAAALRDPTSDEPGPEPEAVRSVRREALGRRWRHLAKERLEDVTPKLPLGRKFWALDPMEREALAAAIEAPGVAATILPLQRKAAERSVRVVDAAYWMKGCSSLGLLRYAVIVSLGTGKGRRSHALIDLKEAAGSVAPVASGAVMPDDPALRVVEGARALSPHLGERMAAVRMLGRPLFVRELAPQDLKIEVDQFSQTQAARAAYYLSFVVGKAHSRQMDAADRRAWAVLLDSDRQGAIDAPSWLWESIVALAGAHESGYLEHCRLYALGQAAA